MTMVSFFFYSCLKDIPHGFYETVDGGHGLIETRKFCTVSDIGWLYGKRLRKEMKTIGMVESERCIEGEKSKERRFFISNLNGDAKTFAKVARNHWGIENSLHWTLDIAFRDDES